MTKRTAIAVLLAAIMAKFAKADEPPTTSNLANRVFGMPVPIDWSVNFENVTKITVYMGGKKISVTTQQIFDALSENTP